MTKQNFKTLYLTDPATSQKVIYEGTNKKLSFGALLAIIVGSILVMVTVSIFSNHVSYISGQYQSKGWDPIITYVILAVVGVLMVASFVLFVITRGKSEKFAQSLGYDPEKTFKDRQTGEMKQMEYKEWGREVLPGTLREKYKQDCPKYVSTYDDDRKDYYFNQLYQKFKKGEKYEGQLCYEDEEPQQEVTQEVVPSEPQQEVEEARNTFSSMYRKRTNTKWFM